MFKQSTPKKNIKKTKKRGVPIHKERPLTPDKVKYTYPDTCINPIRDNPLSPLFEESTSGKPVPKSTRKYYNSTAHPECQDLNLPAGYHSALMKQLEICEELQRAQIDIMIVGLSKADKEEMLKKYGDLI